MKEPVKRQGSGDVKMLPIMLGVLAGFWVIGIAGQYVAKYVTHRNPIGAATAPAAAPAPAATPAAEPAPAASPAPVAAAPAAPEPTPAPAAAPAAAVVTAGGLAKIALAGGAEIEGAAGGIESKVHAFITDPNAVVDKKIWFDFDRLNFESGAAKLTADSKAQVDNIAAILKAYPNVKIKIGGYTDNVGNPEDNLALSRKRAKSVMEALVAARIAPERIEAEGYGELFPIADNSTPEGRAKNRRIAVSVRAK